MKTFCVLGLFYGDEGKGLATSNLAKRGDLVVRYNSGSQAGHTVEKDGYRHVFSSLGSGTLNGADTYWSEYCALYPKSLFNEMSAVVAKGYSPKYYIHPLAPITTPFDIDRNRATESVNKHGSVGMGFGATIARQETPYKLYARDLSYPVILKHKLRQIAQYYGVLTPNEDIEEFMMYVNYILEYIHIVPLQDITGYFNNIIFEGAQGIMLDMDHGFFPNVTRSNTTSKNAMQIIKDCGLPLPEIYYCMRSYLTRHGNGYMPNEFPKCLYEDKTNVSHKYQGDFRQGSHSLSLLQHSLNCDDTFSFECRKNIVVTCLNQTHGSILLDNRTITPQELRTEIYFDNLFVSDNPLTIKKLEYELHTV